MPLPDGAQTFTAGDDVRIGQFVIAVWSKDESEILILPQRSADIEPVGISFGSAKKGEDVIIVVKGTLPKKPSEADTAPNRATRK